MQVLRNIKKVAWEWVILHPRTLYTNSREIYSSKEFPLCSASFQPRFDLVCSKYNLERSTRVPKHCCEIRLLIWILSAVNMHCKEKSQHKINQPSVKAFPAGLCFPRQTCTSGCPMCLRVWETEKACWNIDGALTFLHSQHQKQHGMSLRASIIIPHPSLSHPLSWQ